MNLMPIVIDDPEYEAARRRVLGAWGAELRARLRMAEGIPQATSRVNNPKESRKKANRKSALARARQNWKQGIGVAELPLNAPPVRHPNSIVVKLAGTLRDTIGVK
jgi:hypothetical protein